MFIIDLFHLVAMLSPQKIKSFVLTQSSKLVLKFFTARLSGVNLFFFFLIQNCGGA